MTLAGTNTYVVGAAPCWVIDPGPDHAGHVVAVRDAGESRGGIEGVVLTHSHADHSAGVERLGAPLAWGEVGEVDETAALATSPDPDPGPPPVAGSPSGSRVGPFEVVPTPGHAGDHVAFVWEDVCFCGDLVLGEGSSIVPSRAFGGSLGDYLESLRRVRELGVATLAPGHGPVIADPAAKIDEYLDHRGEREDRLMAALDAGERSRARLLETVWDDVPEVLRPAAAVAMQAHLEKLQEEGRVKVAELKP